MKDLLFKLLQGTPCGTNEDHILTVAAEELSKYATVFIDHNKNVIGTMGNKNAENHILLDAHIDKIGLVVTDICDGGFLKVAARGGVDCRVLPGSTVKINSQEEIYGVICSTPPHLKKSSDDEFLPTDKLFVDTGLSTEKAKKLIEIGTFVEFSAEPKMLLNNRITSPALDDRAGVCALLLCAKILASQNLNCAVSFVFSQSEELNSAGAKTAAFALNPTSAIAVDVSFARQALLDSMNKGVFKKGPMIGISPTISKDISSKLIDLAKQNNIPYQLEVMGQKTGTNADHIAISRCGVKTGLLSIPLRNMHTPVEVVDLDDIKNTAELLALYILKGGIACE